MTICKSCKGKGYIKKGFIFKRKYECYWCNGKGYKDNNIKQAIYRNMAENRNKFIT